MSYVSTLIGKISGSKQRAHRDAIELATRNVIETLEGRQLLSAVSISSPSVAEGGNLVYTVSLSAASNKPVTVNYAQTGGTAKSGRDYLPVKARRLSFAAGETEKTITVKTKDNHLFTTDKTVQIRLTGPSSGNKVKGSGLGTGTIINTDAPPVITVSNAKITEGQKGTKVLTFNVKMTGGAESPVQVKYATQNVSAVSNGKNADYNKAKGTLTFTKKGKQQVKVIIRGDKTPEANEAFLVNFKPLKNGATIVNPLAPDKSYAVGSILNDDGGSVATGNTVSAVPPTVSINRGSTAGVTITLNRVSADPVTVDYSTADGTATAGSDYTATSGSVTFNPGETEKVVQIPILAGTGPEESFTFNVSGATGGAAVASPSTTVNLTNTPLAKLSVDNISVTEGNNGTTAAKFTVTLSAASTQPISVDYSFDGIDSTEGSDFIGTDGTLVFAPGETSKTVTASILGDTLIEGTGNGTETFSVTLSNPVNASTFKGVGLASIVDDDSTNMSFDTTTGHNFNAIGGFHVTGFHYGLTNQTGSTLTNVQLKFFLVPAGADVYTLTPYKTTTLGTVTNGQTLTGDVDLTGSPAFTAGSGAHYVTLLVANGVTYDISKSIPL